MKRYREATLFSFTIHHGAFSRSGVIYLFTCDYMFAGTGMSLPNQAQQVLSMSQEQAVSQNTPAIATQCFMLSNMFDPNG